MAAPSPVVLAVDVGGTKVAAALVKGAEVLAHAQLPTPAAAGPAAVVSAVLATTRGVIARHGQRPTSLGVACAGVVRDGRVHAISQDLLPGWHGYPLVAELEDRLQLPVTAVNDAQAAAYGEWRHGAGKGYDSLIFVTVSTGVGGGLVLGGRLWRGATGLAGHVGHMAAGQVERLASGTALARRAREAGHAANARQVIAEAVAGSPWAEPILNEAVAALARMLTDVKLLADPALAVLGGGVGLNPDFRQAVLAALEERPAHTPLELVPAQFGGMAGLVGAAALAEDGETGTKLPAVNE